MANFNYIHSSHLGLIGRLSDLDNRHNDPFYPRFWEERLGQIPLFGKSLGIFTCDMSDLFGIGVPKQWTDRVLNHIGECHRHRFYLLTKQPQNLIKFSPFPDNCWVGVTATDNEMAFAASANLASVKAKIKYISFEPLLGRISPAIVNLLTCRLGVQWVIIGAQTKPYKPPKIEWVEEIVRACNEAGVKVFLKDNLRSLILDAVASHKVQREQFLVGRGLRQELP